MLTVAEQTQSLILRSNYKHILNGINELKKVPRTLFDEVDAWRNDAKQKLDLFDQESHIKNFINYDMLEVKSNPSDVIQTGE